MPERFASVQGEPAANPAQLCFCPTYHESPLRPACIQRANTAIATSPKLNLLRSRRTPAHAQPPRWSRPMSGWMIVVDRLTDLPAAVAGYPA